MKILDNIKQNREAWHSLRKHKITSSNVATICGLNPFKSEFELWCEWTDKKQDTFAGNQYTDLGQALEPVVAKWYGERHNVAVVEANALYQDEEYPFLLATPDYRLPDGSPLEIKTGSYRQSQKWELGKAPTEYLLQVQLQLRVLDKSDGVLTAYLGDLEHLPEVPVRYNSELFDLILERAQGFMEKVIKDIPPDPRPSDHQLLSRAMPRHEGEVLTLEGEKNESALIAINRLKTIHGLEKDLRAKLSAYEDQRKGLENQIKLLLGTASTGILLDGREINVKRVNVKEQMRKAYSFERLTY